MANVVRARAVLKEHGNSRYDRERANEGLVKHFKKQVDQSKVLSIYRDKMYFESPSEKRRKKKKEKIAENNKRRKNSQSR